MGGLPERHFASDNYAGCPPEVMRALVEANTASHAQAYGGDETTDRLQRLVAAHFGEHALSFPVFNGTGANVVALMAACPRHAPAVICVDSAHIQCDEGGAPELTGGLKMHLVVPPAGDGKLTPALLESQCGDDSVHRCQAGAVSIANTTELGTVYTVEEVRALADCAHAHGLLLHLDGARVANAAAALGVPLRAFTTDAGVDVLSFGGTKAGAMAAEAVVVLNPQLAGSLPYLRKTAMQLCSKQRFVAAQLIALLEAVEGESAGGARMPPLAPDAPPPLCVRLAARANAMAARLLAGVREIPGVTLPASTGTGPLANAIFPLLSEGAAAHLRSLGYKFYSWNGATGQVRFMCSWDTSERDVDSFLASLRAAAEL